MAASEAKKQKHAEMMKQGVGIPVQLRGSLSKLSTGEVRLKVWDKQERTKRGLQYLGIFWGLSLASVLIPLAHFVLVPGLFVAGPIVAWIVSAQERVILGGEGTCPECGTFFPIARAEDRWPISDLCTKCYKNVIIEKV